MIDEWTTQFCGSAEVHFPHQIMEHTGEDEKCRACREGVTADIAPCTCPTPSEERNVDA